MSVKTLTPKQLRFAELVALDGMTLADAYREAYLAKNMKPETVRKRASELMENGVVAGMVSALKATIQEKTVEQELWSRVDSIGVLKGIATAHESRGNERISAVKELNAMHGFSISKVEHSGSLAAKELMADLTSGQIVQASLAMLRQNRNSPERPLIVAFAQTIMEEEGFDFTSGE
jgi:hypothetical protein